MPPVVRPWRMADPDLAKHLGCEVEQGEGFTVAMRIK
jgi:hypothetical protein